MHHHARRLIDDHQLIVFIDHVQGNILRFDGGIIMRPVEHQGDDIARAYLIITFDRIAVDVNKTGIGGFLDSVTAGMGLMLCQELVDTYGHLTFIHFYTEVFIQRLAITCRFSGVEQLVVIQFDVDYFLIHGINTSSKPSVSL